MNIIEVPDYVELNNAQILEIIREAVQTHTGREIEKIDIFPTLSGRGSPSAHAKVYLIKVPSCEPKLL